MSMGAPWMPTSKRVIRSIPNPLDKSTIVNIYPREILEVNHTLSPGVFQIPAGTYEKPGLLVIGRNLPAVIPEEPSSDDWKSSLHLAS